MEINQDYLRHIMVWEFHKNKTAAETHRKIVEIHGNVISERTCRLWFNRFKSKDFSIQDREGRGRKVEIDVESLKDLVESDPRQTLREMATILDISHGAVRQQLNKMGKVLREGIWIPKDLRPFQLKNRMTIASSLITRQEITPFLRDIVTGDEKWVMYVNVKKRKQYLSRGQTPLGNAKTDLNTVKIMLCVWWTINGIVHWELLPPNSTVDSNVYCQQLDIVNYALLKKYPALVNRRRVLLLHDNARPHVSKVTQNKIKDLGWEVLPHPPYSPDIAPTDYHLFRSLQHYLTNKRYANEDDVKYDIQIFFDQKPREFYRRGIESLPSR